MSSDFAHPSRETYVFTECLRTRVAWFLATLHRAVDDAQHTLDAVLEKTRFWQQQTTGTAAPLNERQARLINRLLDGFEGKLTTSKWAAIAKCSPDTALRDITDLLTRGVLQKSLSAGRSTSYVLNRVRRSAPTVDLESDGHALT